MAQIDKTVSRAAVDETAISIAFDDVTVSIDVQGGYVEAAMSTLASGAWDVWRPGDIPER